jgi:hypothetical protein
MNPEDIRNLPDLLREAVAVFKYGDSGKAQNLIIDVQKDKKNFLVGTKAGTKNFTE